MPLFTKALLVSSIASICALCSAGELQISQRGALLLKEDFDGDALPKLFTVGVGDWSIVDHALRGRQQEADHHTAFRKIFLDHQDVIYEFDMKIEGEAYSQILINFDLVHLGKCVTRLDEFAIYKVMEQKKREQMAAEGRDQGLDPLRGQWSEKTHAIAQSPVDLVPGKWYHVIIESLGDTVAMQIDGHAVRGSHVGFTERKTNFGFQAGGFDGYVYYDSVRVWQARPRSN